MSGRCRAGDKLHDGVKILVFAQASKVERLPQFGLPLIPLQLNLFEEIARLLIGRTTDELLVSEREFACCLGAALAPWAGTFNGPYAHYDLGAGGRSVTTDCHDASDASGGESSNPHGWAGGQLKGISIGMNRRF